MQCLVQRFWDQHGLLANDTAQAACSYREVRPFVRRMIWSTLILRAIA
jgi:hypothetical protein